MACLLLESIHVEKTNSITYNIKHKINPNTNKWMSKYTKPSTEVLWGIFLFYDEAIIYFQNI